MKHPQPIPEHATSHPQGKVIFVGAGPGHPDLLTLRAMNCLQEADVVVYDTLVPSQLLDLIHTRVERIPVPRTHAGDTGAAHTDPGETTGHLLAALAAKGRMVVRLKGGDPAVFGRLAEELQPVREAGIAFEIVPGITAALAAAAAAGMPLTSRSSASSVTILTGHEAEEKNAVIDFQTMAGLSGTLAIYMGVEQADAWSRGLIAAGKSADTPVTVVSRCSWPDQQIAVTTLGACAADFDRCGWPSPAVVIVGEVSQPTEQLLQKSSAHPTRAHDDRPLAGQRVLLTRPSGQAEELSARIHSLGGECLHVPTIQIEPPLSLDPLDRAIGLADTFDWIVFASANGVRAFVERMRTAGLDGRSLGTARLAAIGPATHRAIAQAGLTCNLTPALFRSEGIVDALGHSMRGGRFLLVRADHGRDLMRRKLQWLGHHVTEVVAYRSVAVEALDPKSLAAIDSRGIDWVILTSSLNAEASARLFTNRMRCWKIASISPVTSAAIATCQLTTTAEALEATSQGLVDAIVDYEKRMSETSAMKALPLQTLAHAADSSKNE